MAATLHVLRPQTPPIAGYLRVGHTGHQKLLDLHAAGRLPFRRIVFDAAHFHEQVELAKGPPRYVWFAYVTHLQT